MSWLLLGSFLLGTGFGVVIAVGIWFAHERKPGGLRDMDQAEDFVNVLDQGSFLRLRSAVMLRTHRKEHHASGAA
jgi:hypothetical protein